MKKEDPSLAAFDECFKHDQAKWAAEKQQKQEQQHTQHRSSVARSASQSNLSTATTNTALAVTEPATSSASFSSASTSQREPTEVLLRGFKPGQQYAAIDAFERIGGARICEDYARDPPNGQRFKSGPNFPPRPLTTEEKMKVNRYAGGEDWIKVTFESSQAADRAVYAPPQLINGNMVRAELYRGPPNPSPPVALPSAASGTTATTSGFSTSTASRRSGLGQSSTLIGDADAPADGYCTRIPTARRAVLLPAEQALLPRQTFSQKWILPYFGNWGDIIGDETPRLEDGTFDYAGANLWWKVWYWLDYLFRLHLIDD